MQLLAVGLNHTTAPITLREKIAFSQHAIGEAVVAARTFFAKAPLSHPIETAILSTCNRTEIYTASQAPLSTQAIAAFLSHYHGLSEASLLPYLYTQSHMHAVRHAFRVASSLDSMVVGETQILGQFKAAIEASHHVGGLGTYLNQLFQRTFSVAKEVRHATAIGQHSVSMAAATVRLAKRIFDDLSKQHILFIGAGEMITLCATHFAAQQPCSITIANRTLERGAALAHQLHATSIPLKDLPTELAKFDIVISCTASSLPIIGLGLVERAIKARKHKPLFMVDLAVPRDIEEEVARLDDVFLYDLDDLQDEVNTGLNKRKAAIAQAEAIIETRVQSFMHWMACRQAVPAIQQLTTYGETIRHSELQRARRMLLKGDSIERVLDQLSHRLTAKLLHGSKQALHTSEGAKQDTLINLLSELFYAKPD